MIDGQQFDEQCPCGKGRVFDGNHACVTGGVRQQQIHGLDCDGILPGHELNVFTRERRIPVIGDTDAIFREFGITIAILGFETDSRVSDHALGRFDDLDIVVQRI